MNPLEVNAQLSAIGAKHAGAKLADVPTIVSKIRALRLLGKQSGMQTLKTQNAILRALSPEVLTAVAEELAKDAKVPSALTGGAL